MIFSKQLALGAILVSFVASVLAADPPADPFSWFATHQRIYSGENPLTFLLVDLENRVNLVVVVPIMSVAWGRIIVALENVCQSVPRKGEFDPKVKLLFRAKSYSDCDPGWGSQVSYRPFRRQLFLWMKRDTD
jgi:hypothetical protein